MRSHHPGMPWPGHGRPGRGLISTLAAIPALISLVACTGGSAPTVPSQPTVQAATTQVTGAVSPIAATAQAAAPTVQAAASPVAGAAGALAGTAVAAVSPIATALASPSPSPSPAAVLPAPVRIVDASLADATPWVSLQNASNTPVDVGGWRLEVGTQAASLPTDAAIEPGETLTLHAGDGTSSDHVIYLGQSGEALVSAAQPGAQVRLTDDTGRVVTQTTVPRF